MNKIVAWRHFSSHIQQAHQGSCEDYEARQHVCGGVPDGSKPYEEPPT